MGHLNTEPAQNPSTSRRTGKVAAVSGIGGHGLVAVSALACGEVICVWGGEARTYAELMRAPERSRRLSVQVEDDLFLVPGNPGPSDCVNHACEPNARVSGQVVLVAAREIAAGEEITYDYATTDGSPYDEFECRCGAPSCRRRVTGDDWKLPTLREKYRGWFSPYLQRRIDGINK